VRSGTVCHRLIGGGVRAAIAHVLRAARAAMKPLFVLVLCGGAWRLPRERETQCVMP